VCIVTARGVGVVSVGTSSQRQCKEGYLDPDRAGRMDHPPFQDRVSILS
jgi:hypothetical protein